MSDDAPVKSRKQLTQDLLADREQTEILLAEVASGLSLRDACVIRGIIYSTVQMRLTMDEELRPLYEAARTRQAEAVMDEIKELEERLEGKEGTQSIDPKAAAVLIGSKQWRAERLNPKRYGQRSYQQIETIDLNRQHLDALKQVGQARELKLVGPRSARTLEHQPVTVPAGAVIEAEIISAPVLVPITKDSP